MKKYKHLFFDLDNTLWNFDHNSEIAIKRVLEARKLIDSESNFQRFMEIYNPINDRLWQGYRDGNINKNELQAQRFSESLSIFTGDKFIEGQAVNDEFMAEMPKHNKLEEGAIELMKALSGICKIHIITNGFREVQRRKLAASGLEPYISGIFISEEMSCPKPHIKVFQQALSSVNARKSESIMIGDSWSADIEGARNFGIDQAYYYKGCISELRENEWIASRCNEKELNSRIKSIWNIPQGKTSLTVLNDLNELMKR